MSDLLLHYPMPPDGHWVPLRILAAAVTTERISTLGASGELKQADHLCFQLDLEHLSSSYRKRPGTYSLITPVADLHVPHPDQLDPGLASLWAMGTSLLNATSLSVADRGDYGALLELAGELVDKNVMGQIRVEVKEVGGTRYAFDLLRGDVRAVPDRSINIHLADGRIVSADITWETVGRITGIHAMEDVVVTAYAVSLNRFVKARYAELRWRELPGT